MGNTDIIDKLIENKFLAREHYGTGFLYPYIRKIERLVNGDTDQMLIGVKVEGEKLRGAIIMPVNALSGEIEFHYQPFGICSFSELKIMIRILSRNAKTSSYEL